MWQWLYKLGSPRYFYDMTTVFLPWLTLVSYFLLIVGLVWGLAFAPPDYQMGDNFRIIYIHVPTSIGGIWIYGMMACMAAMDMIWKIKLADWFAKSCAPVGAAYCALCLITGAIWGKPTWGTYWIWDARITSTLILLFIYIGIMALRSAFDSETSSAKAASVLTLVGTVNLPIIYYSVEWWYSLHQPASQLSRDGANPPEIWIPAIFMGFALIGICFISIIWRTRNEILLHESRAQWVKELVQAQPLQGRGANA